MNRIDGVVFVAMILIIPFINLLHLWEMGALAVALAVYGMIRHKAWKVERERGWYSDDRGVK